MSIALGPYLRRLRLDSPRGRIEMRQVVADLGLPRQTVYKWEGATSRPDPEDLRRYCEYLGVSREQWVLVQELRSLPVGAELEVPDPVSDRGDGPVFSGAA